MSMKRRELLRNMFAGLGGAALARVGFPQDEPIQPVKELPKVAIDKPAKVAAEGVELLLDGHHIPGVISLSGPPRGCAEIDLTTLDDTAREFRPGLPDYGEVFVECYGIPYHLQRLHKNRQRAKLLVRFDDTEIGADCYVMSVHMQYEPWENIVSRFALRVVGPVVMSG